MTLAFQLVDYLFQVAPFRFESVVWRFSTLGGLGNSVGNFLLLILLIYWVALTFADKRALWSVGAVAALIAVVLFFGTGSFTLDALQIRARVDASAVRKFDVATAQALIKLLVEAGVATLFAVSAFRAAIAAVKESQRDDRNFDTPILSRSAPMRAP